MGDEDQYERLSRLRAIAAEQRDPDGECCVDFEPVSIVEAMCVQELRRLWAVIDGWEG